MAEIKKAEEVKHPVNQVHGVLQTVDTFNNELTTLNLGPTHPATHGIFQNILQMDGEKIVSGVPTIGSPRTLKEVLMITGQPYFSLKHLITR